MQSVGTSSSEVSTSANYSMTNSDVSALTSEYRHVPVLSAECLEYLHLQSQHTFVDATLGGAGHALRAAARIGAEGCLIGIDQDTTALAVAGERLFALPAADRPRLVLLHGNFGDLDELLLEADVPFVNAFLFDLGLSSYQIDTPSRGFSFKETGPLDMRMDPGKQTLTAAEIINTYNAADLARILRTNADERWSGRIASFIVEERKRGPITTSDRLVEVIKAAIPASARRRGGHPAKRSFQALRIEVNQEREVLKRALEAAIAWLAPKGRIVVLSYHSIEDRIVKEVFANAAQGCRCPPDLPVCTCGHVPTVSLLTRKALAPSSEEIARNPRARSARLRAVERIG